MADTSELNNQINALRNETEPDAITPDVLGRVLQAIVDFIAAMGLVDISEEADLAQRVTTAQSTAEAAQSTATTALANAAKNVIDAITATPAAAKVTISVKQHGHNADTVDIPAATSSEAGVMSAADKQALTGVLADVVNFKPATLSATRTASTFTLKLTLTNNTVIDFDLPMASTSYPGLMTPELVTKVNTLETAIAQYNASVILKGNDGRTPYASSPHVVLRNVTDTVFDDLAVGDYYYDSGYIFKHNGDSTPASNLGAPDKGVIYCHRDTGLLYRWTGSRFSAVGGDPNGGSVEVPTKLSELANDVGFIAQGGDNRTPYSRSPHVVLRNVTDTVFDDLAVGDYYYDSGSIFKHNGDSTAPTQLGAPDKGTIYCHRDTGLLYRWTGTMFTSVGGSSNDGVLTEDDVNVESNQDGTVDINVGNDTYKINLNHTHAGMAKLVVCEESDLPSTLENDTIYAITDSGETEIEKLIIHGIEFTGGGSAPGTPGITKPSGTTLNLGSNSGSGVSKAVEIKANNHITGDITVGLAANSDLSFDTTNLPSGVSYNSGAGTLTIAQATAMQGVNITIVYSGSGAAEIQGGLVISHGGSVLKSVVVVVVELPYVILEGVKLTGTQWLQTNYYPNAKTEFTMKVKFTSKGGSLDSNHAYFFTCANNTSSDGEKFQLYHTALNAIAMCNKTTAYYNGSSTDVQLVSTTAENFVLDNSIISYTKGQSNGTLAFIPGGDNSKKVTHATSLKEYTMQNPVRIGRGNTYIYEQYELTIKELTFTEDGVTVQHWVPRSLNGVAGLLDTVNGTFITSEVSGEELVAVPL